jgi:hypothetical protein
LPRRIAQARDDHILRIAILSGFEVDRHASLRNRAVLPIDPDICSDAGHRRIAPHDVRQTLLKITHGGKELV